MQRESKERKKWKIERIQTERKDATRYEKKKNLENSSVLVYVTKRERKKEKKR